jgi:hypothetical protein
MPPCTTRYEVPATRLRGRFEIAIFFAIGGCVDCAKQLHREVYVPCIDGTAVRPDPIAVVFHTIRTSIWSSFPDESLSPPNPRFF